MSEYRICYNPFSKDYISGNNSHTNQIYNKGKQKLFNEYIRGIVLNNTLYLRVYYPHNDINILDITALTQASYELLYYYKDAIINIIRKSDKINIQAVKYNFTNDLLRGLKLVNI